MIEYPARRWALTSLVEWAGKTTFMAANIKTPGYVIDADSRWGLVKHLAPGGPDAITFAAGGTMLDPLALMEDVQRVMSKGNIRGIICDPVTKLYSVHSRRASMAGRLSAGEREKRGYGKNVAKLHVNKADVIEVITNLSMYGVDVMLSWHLREGINAKGQKGVRDRISEVELNTLRQSIDVELQFVKEVNPAWQQKSDLNAQNYLYGVTVVSARGLGGNPVSTGFTIWDPAKNYWVGAAARLERLIYTSFAGPDQAVVWATKQFEGDPPVDLNEEYKKLRGTVKPKNAGQMYSQWIEHVDRLVDHPEQPAPEQPKQPEKQVVKANYQHGDVVAKEDLPDYVIYQKKFGQVPVDKVTMTRAKDMNKEKGTWE